MAGRIPQQAPQSPLWPWPRSVRESLIRPAQLDRKKRAARSGDPKNPPLASAALLDFMGAGHSSEDLRLPAPEPDPGSEGGGGQDAQALQEVVDLCSDPGKNLERAIQRLQIPPDRLVRMQALLAREAGMLAVVSRLFEEVQHIRERMREERSTQDS